MAQCSFVWGAPGVPRGKTEQFSFFLSLAEFSGEQTFAKFKLDMRGNFSHTLAGPASGHQSTQTRAVNVFRVSAGTSRLPTATHKINSKRSDP